MERKLPSKVKITVLKTLYHADLVNEYILPERQAAYGPCYRFKPGDEFIINSFEFPENFCPWAWADIHREVMMMMMNAEVPISSNPGNIIAACTDGLRPVIFKIERVDE